MEALILRFGLFKVAIGAFLLLLVLFYSAVLGTAKFRAWYYEGKVHRVEAKLETAKAETKVARQDEQQITRSSNITAETTAAQDEHATRQRTATAQTTEVIHERIRQAPAAMPVPDDPVVRDLAAAAVTRAQAAQDRVRGAPPD